MWQIPVSSKQRTELSSNLQILFGFRKLNLPRLCHGKVFPNDDSIDGCSGRERWRQLRCHRASQILHRRLKLLFAATSRQLLEAARQRRLCLQWVSLVEARLRLRIQTWQSMVRCVQSLEPKRTRVQVVQEYRWILVGGEKLHRVNCFIELSFSESSVCWIICHLLSWSINKSCLFDFAFSHIVSCGMLCNSISHFLVGPLVHLSVLMSQNCFICFLKCF